MSERNLIGSWSEDPVHLCTRDDWEEVSRIFNRTYIVSASVEQVRPGEWILMLDHAAWCGHRAMCGLETSWVKTATWREAVDLSLFLVGMHGRYEVRARDRYFTGRTRAEAMGRAAQYLG